MPGIKLTVLLLLAGGLAGANLQAQPSRQIGGFSTPESVAVGPDGNYYVSNIGSWNSGDGKISQVTLAEGEVKVSDFVTKLDNPTGIALFKEDLYVADRDRVWKVSLSGQVTVFLAPGDFPVRPKFLNDTAFDNAGNLYISDTERGLVFRATPEKQVTVFLDKSSVPGLSGPNGLIFDAEQNLYLVDLNTGTLWQIKPDGTVTVLVENVGAGDGLAFDSEKNLYISDFFGRVLKRDPQGTISIFAQGLVSPADITIDIARNLLVVPEFDANRLTLIPLGQYYYASSR
jgi:streptogramin lyase